MKWIWEQRAGLGITIAVIAIIIATGMSAHGAYKLNKRKEIRVQQLIVIVGQPQDESEVLKILSDWLEVEK